MKTTLESASQHMAVSLLEAARRTARLVHGTEAGIPEGRLVKEHEAFWAARAQARNSVLEL